MIKGQLFLGQDNFVDNIKDLLRVKEKLKEITREQRYVTSPPLNEILPQEDKRLKNQAIYQAYSKYGYPLKEIAEYLGVHYSTASKVIKRIKREDEK